MGTGAVRFGAEGKIYSSTYYSIILRPDSQISFTSDMLAQINKDNTFGVHL